MIDGCEAAVDAWRSEQLWLLARGLGAVERYEATQAWWETAQRGGCPTR